MPASNVDILPRPEERGLTRFPIKFRPMLAAPAPARLLYPLLASPKLNGVRATVIDGQLQGRLFRVFENRHTQEKFSVPLLEKLDGMLILGDPAAPGVFPRTSEALRRVRGTPELTLYVFDDWTHPGWEFIQRLDRMYQRAASWPARAPLHLLRQHVVRDRYELRSLESEWAAQGYDGAILRYGWAPYKFGRNTMRGGIYRLKFSELSEHWVVTACQPDSPRSD